MEQLLRKDGDRRTRRKTARNRKGVARNGAQWKPDAVSMKGLLTMLFIGSIGRHRHGRDSNLSHVQWPD
jgi:hypothetical protein